jgi:hypothetical protein
MAMTNKEFSRTPDFVKLCELSEVKPTKRQASKFRMGKGDLFKGKRNKVTK